MKPYRQRALRSCVVTFATFFGIGLGGVVWAGHQWAHWHWASNNTNLNFCNRTDVGSGYHTLIDNEAGQWGSTVFDINHLWHSCPYGGSTCYATDGRYLPLVANAADWGGTGWLGLAELLGYAPGPGDCCLYGTCSPEAARQCHVQCGIARLNRFYLDNRVDNCKRLVACQELGHVLGLDHQYDPGDSCMNDFAPCAAYPDFNQHDIDQLAFQQSHCP